MGCRRHRRPFSIDPTPAASGNDVNNCVEAESNQEWAAIAREHRELEIDRASRIFERQRQAAIEEDGGTEQTLWRWTI